MKTVAKKNEKEVTPENISGACFSGKGMTKLEAVEIKKWIAQNKISTETKVKTQISP
ncbi:MAG: hypothetical protein ABIX01_00940 [Chitinophagaceae bacterium]